MLKRWLFVLSLVAVTGVPGWAKPGERLIQTHVNLTLICQDLPGALQNLQNLAGQLGGVVTNSNLQMESGSANANLRLPPAQVAAFLGKARSIGDVQNENVSTSDNTRSHEEARTNLELAEKMAGVEWAPKGNVSPQERLLFEAEFKNFLKDKITNYRSNLASYDEYRKWAEVSVTLQGQPRTTRRTTPPQPEKPQALVEPPAAQPAPAPASSRQHVGLLILPSIFLGVCLAYFIFSRRSPEKN